MPNRSRIYFYYAHVRAFNAIFVHLDKKHSIGNFVLAWQQLMLSPGLVMELGAPQEGDLQTTDSY